jgi:hypothetical protein
VTKQVIRVPTVLNDGAHRPVQEAVRRVNANFTELYAMITGGAGVFGVNGVGNGDGVTDNLAAWNTFIGQHDYVVIAPGEFLFSAPMVVLGNKNVIGSGSTISKIKGTAGQPATIIVGTASEPFNYNIVLRDVGITGTSDVGLLVQTVVRCIIDNITCGGTFPNPVARTNGFRFYNTQTSNFSNLSTENGPITDNCFLFEGYCNANKISHIQADIASAVNIRIDAGHESTWEMLTCQGGDIGLYVSQCVGGVINGLYTENTGIPAKFGSRAGLTTAIGMVINGAEFMGPDSNHRNYASRVACLELDYCNALTFNSPFFSGATNTSGGANVVISGTGTDAKALARINADGTIHSLHIVRGGSGYTGTPTVAINATSTGSGATATATQSGGVVNSLTLTAAGSGYAQTHCPVAVRYDTCVKTTIINPYLSAYDAGQGPFYPYIVRTSGAPSDSGVNVTGMMTSRHSSVCAIADMRKSQGNNYTQYITEITSAGVDDRWSYVVPSM